MIELETRDPQTSEPHDSLDSATAEELRNRHRSYLRNPCFIVEKACGGRALGRRGSKLAVSLPPERLRLKFLANPGKPLQGTILARAKRELLVQSAYHHRGLLPGILRNGEPR